MPLRHIPLGPVVPNLTAIAREAWPRVLAALPTERRTPTALHPYLDAGGRAEAVELAFTLPPSQTDKARKALRAGTPIPAPRAERRGWRTMTVRIPERNHEDLVVVAELLGTRPAELARMLVLNGVRRALADQDAIV